MHLRQLTPLAVFASILFTAAGCAPRLRVTANPGPDAPGIRYYRPKPYLKVVPAEIQIAKDASRVEPGLVTISLEYLPDFSEEYAIDVRSGFGVADVSLQLEDGWNLTEINQELDSQTDENISAAGDLIKAVSGMVPTAEGAQPPAIEITVPATDVPLGFYESVIGRRPDGRKQLYGFRYLGFLPYQSCPTVMGGVELACCGDPTTTLYGLTFADGRMVFKPLPLMAADSSQPQQVARTSGTQTEAPSPDVALDGPTLGQAAIDLAARLESDLLSQLQQSDPAVQQVRAAWIRRRGGADVLRVTVFTSDGAAAEAIRHLAVQHLGDVAEGQFMYDVEMR